ncbi:hypothetical protein RN001_005365 [Aquatica leii]|uniref:Uncharacterized protein n=1 Tax=Aquatica leii TaxID=1421715 RepID=A0AAN7SAJ4_9COLE|nr:hypothetical protein RN001_005365 [Aquatica leii]
MGEVSDGVSGVYGIVDVGGWWISGVHGIGVGGGFRSLGGVLEGILINSGRKLGRSFRVWESGDYHLILTTPLAPIL